MRRFIIDQETTLLPFLKAHLQKGHNACKSILKRGQVVVNNQPVTAFDYLLKRGDQITIIDHIYDNLGLDIIYEDEELIAINKPVGLLSISDHKGTISAYQLLSQYVKQQDPSNKIFIIHRLDKPVSGIILFAKNYQVKMALQNDWARVTKTYLALVEGVVSNDGHITSSLQENKLHKTYVSAQGKKSHLQYKIVKKYPTTTLLSVTLGTGRKHQIRAQLADIHHPIVGDLEYGATTNPYRRLALHSAFLRFFHPTKKEWHSLSQPIDFTKAKKKPTQ